MEGRYHTFERFEATSRARGWSAYCPRLPVNADIPVLTLRARSGREQMQQCEAKITQ